MEKQIIKKIMIMVLLVMQLMQLLGAFSHVEASIKEGDVVHLLGDHECDSLVEYWMEKEQKWSYKIVWYVYYIDQETKVKYPAFCIEPAKGGVGTGYDSYDTTIRQEKDNRIWRILNKGYMGSTYKDWNLECDDDFYSATKIALHSLAEGVAPKDKYILGNRSVDGNSVEEIRRRGEKALNVAQTLYEYGIGGSETYVSPKVSISKQGENKIETIQNVSYYVQNYQVTGNKTLKSYEVGIQNFPSGTKIFNSKNQEQTSLTSNSFKIAIPINQIKQDIKGTIQIKNAEIKTNPIFYCNSSISEAQSYITYMSGYEKASTSTSLEVKANQSSLEIQKIDQETGVPIANVTFEVKDEKGNVLGEVTTDKTGIANLSNLYPQTVMIKEKKVPQTYILATEEKRVKLEYGKKASVTFENERKKGNLEIVKVDSRDNKTPVPNVTFEVWSVETNKKVATKTTDAEGSIIVNNLKTGEYRIKEIATNEWYVLNTEEKIATVQWNTTSTVTIENNIKTGYIEIIKQDADYSDIKLENVKFEIRDSKDILVDTLLTDEKGYAKSKELPLNEEYTVQETQTTAEYMLSTQIEQVTFAPADEGKTKQVTFTNKHKEGNLKVLKVDADNNKIGMGGVEFELYSEEFQKVIGTYTTNSNGEIIIEGLRTGNYRLKEISTNQWYELAEDTEVTIEYNKTKEITIQNELKKGSVKVIKVDKEDSQITIPNVTFEVQDGDGNVLEKIVTNQKGEAITKKYAIRDYQTLKFHEIKTNQWYALNDEVIEMILKANQMKEIRIGNEKKKGQIKVIKVDLDNNEIKIPNVEFEVLDEAGNVMDTLITDENGEAVSKRLPINQRYTIREIKTLEEYVLTKKTQTVRLQQDEIKEVQFNNEKKKGQIEILKIDAENKEIKLENVEFQVFDSNHELVDTLITNEKGYSITKELPMGEYYIKEIKTNEKYRLNEEEIKVEVQYGEVQTLEIENEKIKGQIKIIKISENDNLRNGNPKGSPIEGVIFEIRDEKGQILETLTTNEEGMAISKELEKGNYTIKEIKSHPDYEITNEEFKIEIEEHQKIEEIVITNLSKEPEKPKLPRTGF